MSSLSRLVGALAQGDDACHDDPRVVGDGRHERDPLRLAGDDGQRRASLSVVCELEVAPRVDRLGRERLVGCLLCGPSGVSPVPESTRLGWPPGAPPGRQDSVRKFPLFSLGARRSRPRAGRDSPRGQELEPVLVERARLGVVKRAEAVELARAADLACEAERAAARDHGLQAREGQDVDPDADEHGPVTGARSRRRYVGASVCCEQTSNGSPTHRRSATRKGRVEVEAERRLVCPRCGCADC